MTRDEILKLAEFRGQMFIRIVKTFGSIWVLNFDVIKPENLGP